MYGAIAVAGLLVGWLYLGEPPMGDDLNYWGLAFDLHHGLAGAWNPQSFHDLRWPVWGPCWLLQGIFGPGRLSYYLQPLLYLAAGGVIVFELARRGGLRPSFALAAVGFFYFHPLLGSSISRPMPDLSEGLFVSLAFLLWLDLMQAEKFRPLLAVLIGLVLAVGQANRITGVFAIPVLAAGTLMLYPRHWTRVAAVGVFAAGFVAIEGLVYQRIAGDFFLTLHANMGATGRKGTEAIAWWFLPFRFADTLFRRLDDWVWTILAIVGMIRAGMGFGTAGRALVLFALVYFLAFSVTPQSLFPFRPLVRDGDRFLASMAFPLAVLAGFGWEAAVQAVRRRFADHPIFSQLPVRGWIVGVALVIAMFLLCSRPVFPRNCLNDLARAMRGIPAHTRVLSHDAMRYMAYLADARVASRLDWTLRRDLLRPSAQTLAEAAATQQLWFIRKWIWTTTRKMGERGELAGFDDLAPWLRDPFERWSIRAAVANGDEPQFVLLEANPTEARTPATDVGPEILHTFARGIGRFAMETEWGPKSTSAQRYPLGQGPVPESMRGRPVFASVLATSDKPEALRIAVRIERRRGRPVFLTLKPYLFPIASGDFFFFEMPADATTIEATIQCASGVQTLSIDSGAILVQSL